MVDLQELHEAILNGDAKTAAAVTRAALAQNVPAIELIQQAMVPAMDEVGRRFECQDYFVPELLLSARAMKAALEPLRPLLAASGAQPAGTVVIGTVKGDLHDIGKNLVAALLEGGGFEVIDLGVDVAPEKFVETVQQTNANIVCLSALLTVTMLSMKAVIEGLRAAGLREHVTVLVGGAPVTRQFAEEIGADGYGENASAAVALARSCAKSAAVG
jgi:corrinoid protein of di/trimethylamine methyltransferase